MKCFEPGKSIRKDLYLRPGYRWLVEVRQKLGTEVLRDLLATRELKAFELRADTAEMPEIRWDRWCRGVAVEVLERGFFFEEGGGWGNDLDEREWTKNYHPVFVVVEDKPAPPVVEDKPAPPVEADKPAPLAEMDQPAPPAEMDQPSKPAVATLPKYTPPFMVLMHEAVEHFGMSADNPAPVKKALTDYFAGQMVEGRRITKRMAASMATLVRSPAAMTGGNKKDGNKKPGKRGDTPAPHG